MRFDVITLFPSFFDSPLSTSMMKRAFQENFCEIHFHQLRDFGLGGYKRVDNYPFGGGAGMVLMAEPLYNCYTSIEKLEKVKTFYLSPRGKVFNQKMARNFLNSYEQIILIAGHYEGIDQRFLELTDAEELSIGDFVLTGGEIGVLTVIDAVSRLVPGVLGNEHSAEEESFSVSLLEHDQYTMPRIYKGLKVPNVLTSGNHSKIEKWKLINSIENTIKQRPDIIKDIPLEILNKLK